MQCVRVGLTPELLESTKQHSFWFKQLEVRSLSLHFVWSSRLSYSQHIINLANNICDFLFTSKCLYNSTSTNSCLWVNINTLFQQKVDRSLETLLRGLFLEVQGITIYFLCLRLNSIFPLILANNEISVNRDQPGSLQCVRRTKTTSFPVQHSTNEAIFQQTAAWTYVLMRLPAVYECRSSAVLLLQLQQQSAWHDTHHRVQRQLSAVYYKIIIALALQDTISEAIARTKVACI